MNLQERINETLQSLTEETKVNVGDIKGSRWNDVYWETRNDVNPEGKDLYIVRLHNGGKKRSSKDIARGRVPDADEKYLLLNMGNSPVVAPVGKEWLKKNIGTANLSFTTSEREATKFAPSNPSEMEELVKLLTKKVSVLGARARGDLNFTSAEAIKLDKPADDRDMLGGVSITKENLIKGYISALFTAITSTELGKKIPFDGDLSFPGTNTTVNLTGNAETFYRSVFTDGNKLDNHKCAAVLEQDMSKPLWGNTALSVAAFLYHYDQKPDIMSRARRLVTAMKGSNDNNRLTTCSGIGMAFATNPNLKNFDNDQFAKTVQLIDKMLYDTSWAGIKNNRVKQAPEALKRVIAYYIVGDQSTMDAGESELLRKYLLGEESHLKFDQVSGILPDASETEICKKFSEVKVKAEYKNIESEARTLLLKENEGSTVMYVRYKIGADNWTSDYGLTWDGDSSNDLYSDVSEVITRDILRELFTTKKFDKVPDKTKLYFCVVPEEKSKKYLTINEIVSGIPDKTRIVSDGTVAEIDISGMEKTTPQLSDMRVSFLKKDDGNVFSIKGSDSSGPKVGDDESEDELNSKETVDVNDAEELGAAEELDSEAIDTATELKNLGLLEQIEPDGTDDGEMIRGCTVAKGDIITGHDGKYYIVMKKNIGSGKWDIKSGTKILRWKKSVVDKIREMGFSLNPGNWGNTGVTSESLITDLGYVRNDLND